MIQIKDIYMPQFGKTRPIHIYVPDDYQTSNRKYPVLYMFDGHNLFDDALATYGKSWNLANQVILNHKELIIVGQECNHEGYSRLDEYAPYPLNDPDIGYFEGHGRDTMDFLVDTLKPYIDAHYPTLRDRKYTWIGGSSCGGIMAYYAGIAYSSVFSKAVCVSPYFLPSSSYLLKDTKRLYIEPNTNFYISWGSEETGMHGFVKETKICTELGNILNSRQLRVEYNVVEGGQHREKDWELEAPRFLRFLFEDGQIR